MCLVVVLAHARALGADEQPVLHVLVETYQPVAGESTRAVMMPERPPCVGGRVVAVESLLIGGDPDQSQVIFQDTVNTGVADLGDRSEGLTPGMVYVQTEDRAHVDGSL